MGSKPERAAGGPSPKASQLVLGKGRPECLYPLALASVILKDLRRGPVIPSLR
jgi:hypothetical protein